MSKLWLGIAEVAVLPGTNFFKYEKIQNFHIKCD